jgi:cellulose synthase/poly-beta-1,6-N-acetylglucosamine synthase-like glycosyltransferase
MGDLANFLALSTSALIFSAILMMFVGHRIKTSNRLLSYIASIAVPLAMGLALNAFTSLQISAYSIILLSLVNVVMVHCFKHWNFSGQLTFSFAFQSSVSFFIHAVWLSSLAEPLIINQIFMAIMLVLIFCTMSLMLIHSFEMIDVICRTDWRRRDRVADCVDYYPMVSLHVPAYNEPPEMVIETLDALARIDYPNYEVIMIDDNTTDPDLWKPVEAHCQKLGFKFFHLENWPGFKSGALNFAINEVAPDTEIIGIIDSDYIVQPNYLRETVSHFNNDKVAFVQTPQDYRDYDPDDRFTRACYNAYKYFFKLSMATRNERNGIIFTGTMGLIRRSILQKVGGWDEWCITEDAEIALKILNMGYESVYIDKTYGRGLMPLNFEGLKKQRFRWAFGGMQVIRKHWRKLLPWSRLTNPENKLTQGQKFDFWSGGLQWLNDPIAFLFTSILLVSSSVYIVTDSVLLQPFNNATLYVPLVFILFGIMKMVWALRIRLGCNMSDAYRAFMVLISLTWIVSLACVQGLVKKEGVFLRTPKTLGKSSLISNYRIVSTEALISLTCLVVAIHLLTSGASLSMLSLLIGLLFWQSYLYASALIVNRWSNINQFRSEETESLLIAPPREVRSPFMRLARASSMSVLALLVSLSLFYSVEVDMSGKPEGISLSHQATTFDEVPPTTRIAHP